MSKPRFNIIDAVVILAIIAVIAAGIWYFSTARGGDQVGVYFVVEFRGRMPGFEDNIAVGGEIRDSIRNVLLGRVVYVDVQPATQTTFDNETGVFMLADLPDRYDVYVTIRGNGTENNSEIRSEGELVRIGQEMFLRGRGYAGIGFITHLWTDGR
ncbi:MAG: DUF4330 domain-containing protein [Defluviitaleaceae bacterium]|nr:DUF4330 domain-containing protein [Defluviitaleaceae bacterium]